MSDEPRVIAICGWCRTELPPPPGELSEAEHHMFIAHGVLGASVKYIYPDDFEAKFQAWVDRSAVSP